MHSGEKEKSIGAFSREKRGALTADALRAPYPVFISGACNFNCSFCDARGMESGGERDPAAVADEINAAAIKGVSSLIFAGGEPTISRRLPAYAALARELSIPHIGVRTNALTLSYDGRAEKLIEKGLNFFEVISVSHIETFFDEFTRTPGAFEAAAKGLVNINRQGVPIIMRIPMARGPFNSVREHIRHILDNYNNVARIEFQAVGRGSAAAPVHISEMETVMPDVLEICSKAGVTAAFAVFGGIPPCLFRDPALLLPAFHYPCAPHLPVSRLFKAEECAVCPLDSLCNGMREEYRHDFNPVNRGIETQRLFAAVARNGAGPACAGISSEFGQADDAVTISRRIDSNGRMIINECIIRINYKCNQKCLFCFVNTESQGPGEGVVTAAIDELKKDEAKISIISISGGEPALNRNLPRYIEMLRDTGALELSIQTNAMMLGDKILAAKLSEAGLDSAFVSLHSHDEAVSDLLTGVRGAFEKTINGIEELLRNGIFVYISHVINSFNCGTLPEFVDFIDKRLGKLPVVFSFAAPFTREMMFRGVVPRLSQAREPLREALELCLQRRIPFSGLPGFCGAPLCLLGPDQRYYPDIHPVDAALLAGVMHKSACCRECSLDQWCYGLRSLYVSAFGDGELSAVHAPEFQPKPRNLDSRMRFFKSYFD